jgi:CRP-like cAMP-binding protein
MLYDHASFLEPLRNKLLAALPECEWNRVCRHLDPIDVTVGKTLYDAESRLDYAYFPTTAVISIVSLTADGVSTEIATIGSEGFLGVALVLGDEMTEGRAVVQSKGQIHRLKREFLMEEFSRGAAMQYLLLRYVRALFTVVVQTAVCNQRHSIDQQLCRWILQTLDRLPSQEVTMTHELLANTLGVRREGITEAALKLQSAGLITYRRGRITVIDRSGLTTHCCECYAVARKGYDRLLESFSRCAVNPPLATARPRFQFSARVIT